MRELETDEYERIERLRKHSSEGLALAVSTLSTTAVSTSTTVVSEGFESESERMKEKNLRLGLLVKSKTVSFGPLLFFLFFYFL